MISANEHRERLLKLQGLPAGGRRFDRVAARFEQIAEAVGEVDVIVDDEDAATVRPRRGAPNIRWRIHAPPPHVCPIRTSGVQAYGAPENAANVTCLLSIDDVTPVTNCIKVDIIRAGRALAPAVAVDRSTKGARTTLPVVNRRGRSGLAPYQAELAIETSTHGPVRVPRAHPGFRGTPPVLPSKRVATGSSAVMSVDAPVAGRQSGTGCWRRPGEANAIQTLIRQRRLTPSCGGLSRYCEENSEPVGYVTESLTANPRVRERDAENLDPYSPHNSW